MVEILECGVWGVGFHDMTHLLGCLEDSRVGEEGWEFCVWGLGFCV